MVSSKESLRKYLFGNVPDRGRIGSDPAGEKYRILLLWAGIDPVNLPSLSAGAGNGTGRSGGIKINFS
jgi:hypothetical protein